MSTILIINVDTQAMPGAEKYLSEPAMGNQKPGTPEYAAKWQEKRNKQLQELGTSSFYAAPVSIQYGFVDFDGLGFDQVQAEKGEFICTVSSVKDFFHHVNSQAQRRNFGSSTGIIAGVHPHTHSRVILNTAIRHGMQVPSWLLGARILNPWRIICTSAEAEYPVSWVALGKKPVTPVQDTFDLLKAAGPGIMVPRE